MDKNLKILIVGSFCFPFGSASASRIRTIAKGLQENGAIVHVITNMVIPNIETYRSNNMFFYEDISFESSRTNEYVPTKQKRFARLYNTYLSNKKTRQRVEYYIKDKGFDALYIYGRKASENIPLLWLAKRNGVPVFYDMVEWMPAKAFSYGFLNPHFYNDLLGRLISPLWCNGIIAITTFIAKKYKLYNTPCIIVPSVFDFSKQSFSDNENIKKNVKDFTLLYAGNCKAGDGFGRLIGAMKIAINRGYQVNLNVIGTDGSVGRAAKYRKICENDKILKKNVSFIGRVSDESYIRVLTESACLVLPRPNVQVVRASFPTRLPEFLSTGRPVLTTDVPDVPLYLKANKEAVIVSGDTTEAIADGIIDVCRDPVRADRIGKAGLKRARIEFDYKTRTNDIYKFILKHTSL